MSTWNRHRPHHRRDRRGWSPRLLGYSGETRWDSKQGGTPRKTAGCFRCCRRRDGGLRSRARRHRATVAWYLERGNGSAMRAGRRWNILRHNGIECRATLPNWTGTQFLAPTAIASGQCRARSGANSGSTPGVCAARASQAASSHVRANCPDNLTSCSLLPEPLWECRCALGVDGTISINVAGGGTSGSILPMLKRHRAPFTSRLRGRPASYDTSTRFRGCSVHGPAICVLEDRRSRFEAGDRGWHSTVHDRCVGVQLELSSSRVRCAHPRRSISWSLGLRSRDYSSFFRPHNGRMLQADGMLLPGRRLTRRRQCFICSREDVFPESTICRRRTPGRVGRRVIFAFPRTGSGDEGRPCGADHRRPRGSGADRRPWCRTAATES